MTGFFNRARSALAVDRMVAAIVVAALVLAAVFAWCAGGFWRDEANELEMASRTLPDLWASLHLDSFPLASFLFFKLWLLITPHGAQELVFRVLGGMIFLAIVLLVRANVRALSQGHSVLFLAFFVLNPYVVRYASGIRPYGLSAIFLLTALLFLGRFVRGARRRDLWLGTLFCFLGVHCHYSNVVLLLCLMLGTAVACLVGGDKKAAVTSLLAGLIVLATLLVYLPVLAEARYWTVLVQSNTPNWASMGERIKTFFGVLPPSLGGIALYGALLLGCLTWAVATIFRRQSSLSLKKTTWFALLAGLSAPLGLLALLAALRSPVAEWYFIPAAALLSVGADVLASHFLESQPILRRPFLLLTGAVSLSLLVTGWPKLQVAQTDIPKIAAHIQAQGGTKDLIVLYPWYYGVTFHRYYHGGAVWQTLPPLADHSIHRYDLLRRQMETEQSLQSLLRQTREALKRGGTVWFVGEFQFNGKSDLKIYNPKASPLSIEKIGKFEQFWVATYTKYLLDHGAQGRYVDFNVSPEFHSLESPPINVISGWKD